MINRTQKYIEYHYHVKCEIDSSKDKTHDFFAFYQQFYPQAWM